jgi:hypothetical protein
MKIAMCVFAVGSLMSSVSFASSSDCNYGGLQEALRNSADSLAGGNPVRFIDFANDAPFSDALARMEEKGVRASTVERAWAEAINELCGSHVGVEQVGPTQTLDRLAALVGASN